MERTLIWEPEVWAQHTYGGAALGDQRRSKRLVRLASQLAEKPDGSLPQQTEGRWPDLKAAYRLLHEPDVTVQSILAPHLQATRRQANEEQEWVLLVQDLSEIDYGRPADRKVEGLGPVGNGTHQGLLLQSVLAVDPSTHLAWGLAALEVFNRVPVPKGTTTKKEPRKQRLLRERETDVWIRQVQAIGKPEPGREWIHVGDRGADMFRLLQACRQQGCHYLIRSKFDRRVQEEKGEQIKQLRESVAQQAVRGERTLSLPATDKHRAREAHLSLSWERVWLQPSSDEQILARLRPELPAPFAQETWVIHVWEQHPPTKGEVERHPQPAEEAELIEPLDWLLLTSVPTETEAQAWQRVDWYTCRWIVEEYHHGLKTGCRLEDRGLRDAEALKRLIAILAPLAIRLLHLRTLARKAPQEPACVHLPAQEVHVLARVLNVDPFIITMEQFWHQVAHWGGYLGRKSDGPPGWKTLWRGWLRLQTLVDGFRLASSPE